MKILAVGSSVQQDEVRQKFATHHEVDADTGGSMPGGPYDVVFDFSEDRSGERMRRYKGVPFIFFNSCLATLSRFGRDIPPGVFGFCGMPGFLTRPVLEISHREGSDLASLEKCCQQLGTEFVVVADTVGMVTPRVICMIINEAYFTLEEGTASREDIDLAMKLGTNYPFGPFEWCKRIGANHVKRLLHAVFVETQDERYQVCGLLEREALGH